MKKNMIFRNLVLFSAVVLLIHPAAAQAKGKKLFGNRKAEQLAAAEHAADSLRQVAERQAAAIDSLQFLLNEDATVSVGGYITASVDPEQAAADSAAYVQRRLRRTRIDSTFDTEGVAPIDTLASGDDAVQVVLYTNNTWKYVRNRDAAKDPTIFEKYWDTKTLFPYKEVSYNDLPSSVIIDLVDSMNSFHYPYKGKLHPRGKYGPRRGRQHQGVDLPLKTGDPIYAAFSGRVRISEYNRGGYGNLVIIRHDNGLETYYGHLSERYVQPDQWVEAGHIIGLGGSTGRSTGPHLHFETRYYGQSFDPERLIDFEQGYLCRDMFLLKKSYFSIYSNAGQDFDDEIANEEQDKKEEAERAAMKYHKIRSGDTLSAIARKYGTTVTNICRLNGIKSTTVLRIGRTLRVK